jgi:membrane fusion protein (multidrug efflux system)
MVSLQQLDPIYLDFQVPEQDYGHLATGQEVLARVDAFAGKTFHGKISNIDARVDAATRSVLVRAEIANPDKRLMPGMFGHVDFATGEVAKAVTAPRTAVAFSLYGDSVFVVVPDDPAKGFDGPLHVERRAVKVGGAREDRIVLLEGVAPGEKVVAEGQIKLQPNAPVKIDPDKPMKPQAVRPRE